MNKIKSENFTIEFIEQIQVRLVFMYKIKVTCHKSKKFEAKKILCNSGFNLTVKNIFDCNGVELIDTKKMKKDDVIECYIAFQKSDTATNQPSFSYEGKKEIVKGVKINGGNNN